MVGGKLRPGPAFGIRIIDAYALALERFSVERGIRPWLAAQRRLRGSDFHQPPFDKTRRFDFAFEVFRREIGAPRRHARVKARGHLRHSAQPTKHRARAPPDIRRPPAGPTWRSPSRQTNQ